MRKVEENFSWIGECDLSKHGILNMISREMSSSTLPFFALRRKLTRFLASVSIVATINTVHRSVLFVAVASSIFAQVALVAQPAKPSAMVGQPAQTTPSVPQ